MDRLEYEYSERMEHSKWTKEIPTIKFPNEWEIKITPPFAGAVVRFLVKYKKANVSIYLDCYDKLGCVGEPYWEIYPHHDDVFRCLMNDTESLLNAISESLESQNNES